MVAIAVSYTHLDVYKRQEMDNVCKALPCGELLQHCLLIGYGIALTLLVIIFAKVITAQSFVCLLYTSRCV